jgi:hypothetical protein
LKWCIPETTKQVIPEFTAGQYSKDGVASLLGKLDVKNKKAEVRKIKPMSIISHQNHWNLRLSRGNKTGMRNLK